MTQVPYDDIRRALEKADPWEIERKAANKLGAFAKVRQLADSGWPNGDTIEVPIRFGDVRAIDRALVQLAADAQRWRMIEEPSEEVVAKVEQIITNYAFGGGWQTKSAADAARAALLALRNQTTDTPTGDGNG